MPLITLKTKQVLFVHIPKTGGSTIETWLGQHGNVALWAAGRPDGLACPPQHFHAKLLRDVGLTGEHSYNFAIVRDPLERLKSEFFWLHRKKRTPDGSIRVHGVKKLLKPSLSKLFHDWVVDTFEDTRQNPFHRGNHIRPQVEFLDIPHLKVKRFEDGIDQICQSVAHDLGLAPPPQLHENKSQKTAFDIQPKTLREIEMFYREDFVELGYTLPTNQIS